MDNSATATYFREQQMSLQWLPFLRALSDELLEQTDEASLRSLMFKVGQRFAQNARESFEGINTLSDLASALNDFFGRINWGCLELAEVPNAIMVTHFAPPLAEAFGDEALPWSVGVLEGFYQEIFMLLGANSAMTVAVQLEDSEPMALRFRFGK